MKKRGISLLLAILILTLQIAFAFAVTASGKCGDNLTWTLDDSGTLSISGTGTMDDYRSFWVGNDLYRSVPWYSYRDDIRTAIVSNGVTSIGDEAFYGCTGLIDIAIPNSVANIGEFAFYDCNKLTNVIIPNSVTSIGGGAFKDCSNLTNITIPNSVTSIGGSAFQGCSNLTNITIPNSVTSIGSSAFQGCSKLINVTIPNSITNLGNETFYGCNKLANITIPSRVTIIGNSTFSGCSNLTNITIPNSVISIASGAFNSCHNLENIYYGGSQNQWEDVEVGFNNEALINATIHYSITEPNSEPVIPAPQSNGAISQYSYAFANDAQSFGYPAAYRFPLERFQLVYGMDFAKKMKEVDFGGGAYWSGNCYGMATTIGMFSRSGSSVTLSAFRNGATRPGELAVSDTNAAWGLTLKEFIEAMQVSQYSATFASTSKQNRNQFSALLSAMSAFESGGMGPLVICVYGKDKNDVYSGHALLGYRLEGSRLYVYDCNHPNDGNRYITISESGWSYVFSDAVTWSNSNEGDITYIPYETYLLDWYNRGRVLGDPERLRQVMFFINAADATISDSYGNEMAVFQRGKMIRGVEDAYPIPKLGVTADGSSIGAPQIAVWLPYNNEYKVTSWENATVSAVNVSKGVSVNSVAGGQTVSVSLSSSAQPQFNDVTPDQYFYEPVQWAVRRGITNGITSTTFSPQRTCSRNHILTFLWRANGSPAATIANPFSDVDTSGDFGRAAVWAAEKGLVPGVRFNGESPCTRAEAVTYLWRLAGHPSAGRNAFQDVPSNADYAQAVSWAVERGITKGTSDTTFEPSKICTRGQIVTFLYRAYVEN